MDVGGVVMSDPRFTPITGTEMPRYAGAATLMRLPQVLPGTPDWNDVQIGLFGVPWDGGTTNRPGARQGPRQVRDASTMVRNVNRASGINPFALCRCADLGDTPVNPADLADSMTRIERFAGEVCVSGILPLFVGGDHLSTLPVMRAVSRRFGPLGMVHIDAHTDTWDSYFGGQKYTHGTPFRRAIEEGILDPKRTVQIGIRGALYADGDDGWGREQGIRVIDFDEYRTLGVERVLREAHAVVGSAPTYISFDIDALDPAYAPGTGTPEIGGMTTHEAQLLVRGLDGINCVGADVVEVSPPFDLSGNTALAAATLLFEILCVAASGIARARA